MPLKTILDVEDHLIPLGVVQVVVTGVAVLESPVRFVIFGITVIADVAVDGAMAGAVNNGIGVEKLTAHSPNSTKSADEAYDVRHTKRKYMYAFVVVEYVVVVTVIPSYDCPDALFTTIKDVILPY